MGFRRFKDCATSVVIGRAFALCPVCKTSLADAEQGTDFSQAVNLAVLALLVPVLLMICCLVKLVFEYRHSQNDDATSSSGSIDSDSYVNFGSPNTQRRLE